MSSTARCPLAKSHMIIGISPIGSTRTRRRRAATRWWRTTSSTAGACPTGTCVGSTLGCVSFWICRDTHLTCVAVLLQASAVAAVQVVLAGRVRIPFCDRALCSDRDIGLTYTSTATLTSILSSTWKTTTRLTVRSFLILWSRSIDLSASSSLYDHDVRVPRYHTHPLGHSKRFGSASHYAPGSSY